MPHAPIPGRDQAAPPRLARRSRAVVRAGLLAGIAAAALLPTAALAAPRLVPAVKAPPPDDGLGPRDAYIEADTLIDDRQTNIVTARGHVDARSQGRTIRGDELIYNRQTGAAHARGHVMVQNADGTVQYGEDIELDDKMVAGVAYGFAARLDQNVTLAAGAAVRRSETVQQLNNAIFTPCNICNADGSPKTPSFSVQASRVVQDQRRHVIYYRNAIIRIKNIPVLYMPLFWSPDPTADRRSGFLVPRVDYSKKRGFSYEQPYYWAISPSSEVIISPQVNTRVNPLLNVDYRQRFYSGQIDIRAGYTYERAFTTKLFYDNPTSRSYVLGRGKFDIDKNWIWGFGLERVTDPTFFRRYSEREVFIDRGPFPTDTDRLISQIYTRRQDPTSFVSLAAISFQSIRAYGQDPVTGTISGESSRNFPFVGPLLEARYDPERPVLGGRLHADLTAVSLNRSNAVTSLVDPTGTLLPAGPLQTPSLASVLAPGRETLTYTDARRATGQFDWRRSFTLGPGVRVSPFAQGREDIYWISDSSARKGEDDVITRSLGTVGTDVSWPLYRSFGPRSNLVIEPEVQIAASPIVHLSHRIPNEDSVSFAYDESNLFSTDRFSGFDLYEGGVRMNTGVRADALFPTGSASLLVGRTFRTDPDPVFDDLSGLRGASSDWIVSGKVSPFPGISLFSRSRLDSETFNVRREEAGAYLSHGPNNISVRYLYNESGLVAGSNGTITVGKVQNLDLSGQVMFLKNFGVAATGTRDLQNDLWPRTQVALFYLDECLRVDFLYTHDEYLNGLDPSDSFGIRLTLATLGDTTPRRANRGSR